MTKEPKGWYSRGYLPHFDGKNTTQSLTFRLYDSFPTVLIERYKHELKSPRVKVAELEWRKRAHYILDRGHGECFLKNLRVAAMVQNSLLHFDGERYRLIAWVIMPNHVHLLMTRMEVGSLSQVLHSWRSYTANQANKILGRSGPFWARGVFDRYIRNADHYRNTVNYIEQNPVKAGLCQTAAEWPFSSAHCLKT